MSRAKILILFFSVMALNEKSFAQLGIPTPPSPANQSNQEMSPEDQKKIDEYEKGNTTEINVKNADINAIVKIFSKKTKRNYILDERVKGRVSIFLPAKVSSDEALKILEAVLSLKGFTSVPMGENLWKIVPKREARQTTIPTIEDDDEKEDSAAVVTRLMRLKYVSAEDMQKLLKDLISSDGLLNAYSGTNSLIMIDSADNIARLSEIIEAVDVPSSDTDVTLIPIRHAEAKDVADKLTEILGGNSSATDKPDAADPFDRFRARFTEPRAPAAPNASNINSTVGDSSTLVRAIAQAPKIIPDERTNSIIVVADEGNTAKVRALISKLDSEIALGGSTFFVYRCQHANAEELADVLSGLTGSGGGSSSGQKSSSSIFSDSFLSDHSTGSGSRSSSGSSLFGGSGSRNSSSSGGRKLGQSFKSDSDKKGISHANFGEDLSVTADPGTNSLIIFGSRSDYEKLKELIAQLDIKRRQVLVEALILEVGLADSDTSGTEFLSGTGGKDGGIVAKTGINDLATLLKDPTKLSEFTLAAASAGTITLPGDIKLPTQAVLISAAQANTNVNVLSSPTILTADNEEAQIIVGQNIPFVTSTSTDTTNLNNTFNQIERQDVGITLRLTPQISSGDFVTLKLFAEVSSVVPEATTQSQELGPTTTVRTSETTIITKDSQMIVMGGLMSDDISETESGVPFLKDIPLLGFAFKSSSGSRRRTNLLIFITPRIVKDQFDAKDLTVTQRDKMEDVLAYNNFDPNRKEVLHRPEVDRVSEAKIYDGPKPTTILAPEKTSEEPSQKAPPTTTKKTLKLHATPKLPGEELESPRGSLQPSALDSGKTYVVLEFLSATDGSKVDNPFGATAESPLFGLVLPGETSNGAQSYFAPGSVYSYPAKGGTLHAKALGTFDSAENALALYPQISKNWHMLSPYEIMDIGKTIWTIEE